MSETTDYDALDREMDRVKSQVFMDRDKGNHAAFMAPLMCSLDFHWSERRRTAWTNGLKIWWNPVFFRKIGRQGRVTVLMHELWHVAYMDPIRRGSRDPRKWNRACDHRINLQLIKEGYKFDTLEAAGFKGLYDPRYTGLSAEEIYDRLEDLPVRDDEEEDGEDPDADIEPPEDAAGREQAVSNVVSAEQQAGMDPSGNGGNMPGAVRKQLDKYLKPRMDWRTLLHRFFSDLSQDDFTWNRPSRRNQDVYLPSRVQSRDGLEHLVYYRDISGSITERQELRMNSELKYLWEHFQPRRITVVDFHHEISGSMELREGDRFTEFPIRESGGTNLMPVFHDIRERRPTAVVVFSDLYCAPMPELPEKTPVIWVCIGHEDAKVNQGVIAHVED